VRRRQRRLAFRGAAECNKLPHYCRAALTRPDNGGVFIGSINRYMQAGVRAPAERWRGLPVYVACSGSFTVERILARCGVGAIHSSDVSICSCALGWILRRGTLHEAPPARPRTG
jgi:hypothetical protein